MGLTEDRNDPCLHEIRLDGQQACYLVLRAEERARGFVRPVRRSYRHVGLRPHYPMRDLTPEEHERYKAYGYVQYEAYPEGRSATGSELLGRFWTQAQLDTKGCGSVTTMAQEIAETYARRPSFYGATFCCGCGTHLPVAEFVWVDDGTVVGS